jgi:hypothetical protein
MFGTAIDTIVWSMNVIATANTIAVSARYFLDPAVRVTDMLPRYRGPTGPVAERTAEKREEDWTFAPHGEPAAPVTALVTAKRGRRPGGAA